MKNRQAVFLGLVQCGAERQKPPQAGSHKSLMYFFEAKELFYHNGCKFTCVGVDQTLRRPLAVLLFRNCCKRNCISKDNGQFQKAKLRRARRRSRVWSHCSLIPRLLRVTKSADSLIPCITSYRRRQKQQAVFGTLGSR